jgi:hypothetical protein
MSDNIIIPKERLAVVLAYLADKAPEDVRQRREWTRCMAILSAQRKEAPDDAAGKCGECALRGLCDEDTMPGGCPEKVGKQTSTPPPHFDPATVAFPFVTRKELAEAIEAHDDAGHEERSWMHGQIETLVNNMDGINLGQEGIRDSIAKAMRSHERVRHDPTPEHQTCPTCHHHAVCGHVNDNGCASWEGQPLDDMPGA